MNILTFDIEEWFHILDNSSTRTVKEWSNFECRIHANMDRILNFLDETDQKATFFCLGWVAGKYPEVIKEIHKRGFEIGSHTYMHQLIYEQSQQEFKEDMGASIKVLEDIIGTKVTSFRAPGFSLTSDVLWAFEVLVEMGIQYDSSIFPAARAHGGIADFTASLPHKLQYNGVTIKEFPINTKTLMGKRLVFSGGGYFRLIPYNMIRKWTKDTNYVMTYFHPRDFDKDQPMIPDLSRVRKLKSYYGLKGAFKKLQYYTRDFEFIDIDEANRQIDWDNSQIVNIN